MNLTPKCQKVVNYIIEEVNSYNEGRVFREQVFLSTKRLQKILFFSYVIYMIENDGQVMFDDDFYAWPSGPAIPIIYRKFMQYQDRDMVTIDDESVLISEEIKRVINKVLDDTKHLDTCELVLLSQVEDGPWSKVYDDADFECNKLISKQDLFDFYSNNPVLFENRVKQITKLMK